MHNKNISAQYDYSNKKTAFHIHTRYSYDSIMDPEAIVDFFAQNGFETVIITDHNEIEGAREAEKYASLKYGDKLKVIIGEEVKSDIGDVIGFPLVSKIEPGPFAQVVNQMKSQGAYICLPHPYSEHNTLKIHDEEVFSFIDFVEVFNCRLFNSRLNDFAGEYSLKYGIKKMVGSDAHLKGELGNSFFIWDRNFHIIKSEQKYTTRRKIRASTIIKAFKKKKYLRIIPLILYYIIGK